MRHSWKKEGITLYYSIPTFNNGEKKPFENIVGKRRKC